MECLVPEIVGPMEPERQKLDVRVIDLEAKTGMSAHVFDESHQASADEHSSLLKDLHVCEGLLAFFERTVQFQVGWIELLQTQQSVLNHHRFGVNEVPKLPSSWRAAEEGIASSLASSGSFSKETLEQVRTLRNRIRIRLSVVCLSTVQSLGHKLTVRTAGGQLCRTERQSHEYCRRRSIQKNCIRDEAR